MTEVAPSKFKATLIWITMFSLLLLLSAIAYEEFINNPELINSAYSYWGYSP